MQRYPFIHLAGVIHGYTVFQTPEPDFIHMTHGSSHISHCIQVSISESFLMSAAPSCGILPHNRIRLHRTILNILTPSGFLFNDFM